ncbi:MAG: hypothetical protein Q8M76_19160 [Spirochaetaceae bacterium]|nr:hypothetical protein [Spirochaetaceae bacterium]
MRSSSIVFSILLTFAALASAAASAAPTVDGVVSAGEYSGSASFDGDGFVLRWLVDGPTVFLAVDARAEGWVAVGFGATRAMDQADMIFGIVPTMGEVSCVDAFSDGPFGPHPPDAESGGADDIAAFAGLRREGRVVFEFSRPLATGDLRDKDLPPAGPIALIWATGFDHDFESPHAAAGSATLDLAAGAQAGGKSLRGLVLPFHIAFMSLGFISMMAGLTVARYFKTKRWWLKAHKPLGIAGAVSSALGLAAGGIMVQVGGGGHFTVPHAFLGAATLLLVLDMPFLGNFIFKYKGDKKKVKTAHRWLGRTAIMLMAITILSGLVTAGLLRSP